MTLRCYVLDDEDHSVELLTRYIRETPGLELAGANTSPLTALNQLAEGRVDIAFLDVDMPELTGLELADLINGNTMVVFITAHSEYAAMAFDKNAVDYLLKPFAYTRFLKAIKKAKERARPLGESTPHSHPHFFIQTDGKGKIVCVNYGDLLYIEGADNYVRLYLGDRYYITYVSLKELGNTLPSKSFLRIHKSYVINLDKTAFVENNQLVLQNGKHLPIGKSYRRALMSVINGRTLNPLR